MTRLWSDSIDIDIDVECDRRRRPVSFRWKNRLHRIEEVHDWWQIDSDWWSNEGRIWRDCYVAITTNGLLCILFYDRLHDSWQLAKVYD